MAKKKANAVDFLSAARASGKETITLPGMDGEFVVRALSAAEVQRISDLHRKPGTDGSKNDHYDNEAMTLAIIAASITDKNGNRVIPEGREAEMRDLPNRVYMPLQSAALRINGLGVDAGN